MICLCLSMSQYDDETYAACNGGVHRVTYVGGIGEVNRVTRDGQSSRVISVDGNIHSVSVTDGVIYALVREWAGGWSVRVYDSEYQPTRSWRHSGGSIFLTQIAVRKDRVLVPDRESKTIIQYSLTGEVETRIPCPILKADHTWLCVTSSRHDAVIVSCRGTVSCIDLSTGEIGRASCRERV